MNRIEPKTADSEPVFERKYSVIFLLLLAIWSFSPGSDCAYAAYAGNALDFDGDNDYVDCGTGPSEPKIAAICPVSLLCMKAMKQMSSIGGINRF